MRLDLDAYYVDDALYDERVFEEIFDKARATVDGVLEVINDDGSEFNLELLQKELAAMASDMAAAIQTIYHLVPVAEEHEDWLIFRRANSIETGHRGLWEWVYDKVCAERRRELKGGCSGSAEKRSNPYGSLFGDQPDYASMLAGVTVPEISAANRMIRVNASSLG